MNRAMPTSIQSIQATIQDYWCLLILECTHTTTEMWWANAVHRPRMDERLRLAWIIVRKLSLGYYASTNWRRRYPNLWTADSETDALTTRPPWLKCAQAVEYVVVLFRYGAHLLSNTNPDAGEYTHEYCWTSSMGNPFEIWQFPIRITK